VKFTGSLKGGKKTGFCYEFDELGNKIKGGDYANDKLQNGQCMLLGEDGLRWNGLMSQGRKNGPGSLFFGNTMRIAVSGTWEDDLLDCEVGAMYYDNGEMKFAGSFKAGKKNGKGNMYYSNGRK
jgi:antitoxin component YwqK of YwqJK toxin-antitoxin module